MEGNSNENPIKRILILHDAENCYIPSSLSKESALELHELTIRVILETLGQEKAMAETDAIRYQVSWRFYLRKRYNNQHQPNRDFLNVFSAIAGVEVIEPGEESTVETKIRWELDDFATYPTRDTILVLLGGDRDYCRHVLNLRQCDHKPIVVLLHNGSARPTIQRVATYSSPRWTEVIDRARKPDSRILALRKEDSSLPILGGSELSDAVEEIGAEWEMDKDRVQLSLDSRETLFVSSLSAFDDYRNSPIEQKQSEGPLPLATTLPPQPPPLAPRQIQRLLILHDAENCCIPTLLPMQRAFLLYFKAIEVILETLLGRKDICSAELLKYDIEWRFYLKRKYNNQHQPNRDFLNAFSGIAGVEVIEPGEESTADDKIKRALDTFAKYPVADTALVLLGGDRDYCRHLLNLLKCDHKPIVVLLHNGSATVTPQFATYSSPRWQEVIAEVERCCEPPAVSSFMFGAAFGDSTSDSNHLRCLVSSLPSDILAEPANPPPPVASQNSTVASTYSQNFRQEVTLDPSQHFSKQHQQQQQQLDEKSALLSAPSSAASKKLPLPQQPVPAHIQQLHKNSRAFQSNLPLHANALPQIPPSSSINRIPPNRSSSESLDLLKPFYTKRINNPIAKFLDQFGTETIKAIEKDDIQCKIFNDKKKWSVSLFLRSPRSAVEGRRDEAEGAVIEMLGRIVLTDPINIEGVLLNDLRSSETLREMQRLYGVFIFSFEDNAPSLISDKSAKITKCVVVYNRSSSSQPSAAPSRPHGVQKVLEYLESLRRPSRIFSFEGNVGFELWAGAVFEQLQQAVFKKFNVTVSALEGLEPVIGSGGVEFGANSAVRSCPLKALKLTGPATNLDEAAAILKGYFHCAILVKTLIPDSSKQCAQLMRFLKHRCQSFKKENVAPVEDVDLGETANAEKIFHSPDQRRLFLKSPTPPVIVHFDSPKTERGKEGIPAQIQIVIVASKTDLHLFSRAVRLFEEGLKEFDPSKSSSLARCDEDKEMHYSAQHAVRSLPSGVEADFQKTLSSESTAARSGDQTMSRTISLRFDATRSDYLLEKLELQQKTFPSTLPNTKIQFVNKTVKEKRLRVRWIDRDLKIETVPCEWRAVPVDIVVGACRPNLLSKKTVEDHSEAEMNAVSQTDRNGQQIFLTSCEKLAECFRIMNTMHVVPPKYRGETDHQSLDAYVEMVVNILTAADKQGAWSISLSALGEEWDNAAGYRSMLQGIKMWKEQAENNTHLKEIYFVESSSVSLRMVVEELREFYKQQKAQMMLDVIVDNRREWKLIGSNDELKAVLIKIQEWREEKEGEQAAAAVTR